MLTRYGASARGARARRGYDRVMTDTPDPSGAPSARTGDGPRGTVLSRDVRRARAGGGMLAMVAPIGG